MAFPDPANPTLFSCSMDGYTVLVERLVELALSVFVMGESIITWSLAGFPFF